MDTVTQHGSDNSSRTFFAHVDGDIHIIFCTIMRACITHKNYAKDIKKKITASKRIILMHKKCAKKYCI